LLSTFKEDLTVAHRPPAPTLSHIEGFLGAIVTSHIAGDAMKFVIVVAGNKSSETKDE
jgi:hypothetical protein